MNKIININMKKYIIILSTLLLLDGCTNNIKKIEENSPEILYNKAMENFNKKNYLIAGENFKKIEELYPFTPYAGKSIIMAAYSYYKSSKFEDSLTIIENFKKINFQDDYLEYMYYLEILNKYRQLQKNNKKDLMKIKETLKDIDNFFIIYKDSEYKKDIINFKNTLNEYAVKNELDIARFYIKNNNLIGSINHLNNIMENYPISIYTAEVLYRMYVIYKHIDYKKEYIKYFNALEINYNDSKWFKYAKNKENK